METRGYLERMIEQLAAALERIAGARKKGEHEEALREIEDAYAGLVGFPRAMVLTLDAATLARMLGHPEKVKAVIALLEEEAALEAARGDSALAARLRTQARELTTAA